MLAWPFCLSFLPLLNGVFFGRGDSPLLSITLSRPFIPINPDVVRLAADGHQLDPACPAQVCRRKVLDRHAAVLDDFGRSRRESLPSRPRELWPTVRPRRPRTAGTFSYWCVGQARPVRRDVGQRGRFLRGWPRRLAAHLISVFGNAAILMLRKLKSVVGSCPCRLIAPLSTLLPLRALSLAARLSVKSAV
jgi:hypothetical protein